MGNSHVKEFCSSLLTGSHNLGKNINHFISVNKIPNVLFQKIIQLESKIDSFFYIFIIIGEMIAIKIYREFHSLHPYITKSHPE
jgi:hypothetical protein